MASAPYKYLPVWEGGHGNIQLRTIATNEAEAINNLIEKNPLLGAIGCFVTQLEDVDGYPVVAKVPLKFELGNDRRNRIEAERKAKEADLILE